MRVKYKTKQKNASKKSRKTIILPLPAHEVIVGVGMEMGEEGV